MSEEIEQNVNPSILIDVNDTATHCISYNRCENNKNVVLEAQNLSGIGRFLP